MYDTKTTRKSNTKDVDSSGWRHRPWSAGLGLLLLSAATLSFEVMLSRVFSVMLSYHFAFAITSLAMLGFGMGGLLLNRWRQGYPRSSTLGLLYAGSISLSVVLLTLIPTVFTRISSPVGLFLMLSLIPFLLVGLTVSSLFARLPSHASILYGLDLIGTAGGALLVIPLLNWIRPLQGMLFATGVAAVGALLFLIQERRRPAAVPWIALAVSSLGLVAALLGGVEVPVMRDPDKDMYQSLSNPAEQAEVVDSRWSAFGRTDLVASGATPDQMTIYVDGAAGAPMYNTEAVLSGSHELGHLTEHYGASFPFYFLEESEKDTALIIGPGGGRDVLVALLGGVRQITAVEVNPDAVELVRDHEDFNGGIYSRLEQVKVVVDEGRSFVRKSGDRYDLIILSLPVTKSSRSPSGFALTESYLFTVESMQDYLDHLTPEGRIVIVTHGDGEVYKVIGLTIEAFRRQGIGQASAMQRVYTVASGMMPTLVIGRKPFTKEQAQTRHEKMHEMGLDQGNFFVPYEREVELRPDQQLDVDEQWRMFDRVLVQLAEERLTFAELAEKASMNIAPATDDRPFFYRFQRGLPRPFGWFAALVALGVMAGLVLLLKRTPPQTRLSRLLAGSPKLKTTFIAFTLSGAGFMAAEIALFERLTLFVGHPTLALTVLLFSLLSGVGVGSLASNFVRKGSLLSAAAAGAAVVVLLLLLYGAAGTTVYTLGLDDRLVSFLLLFPLGVAAGFPFPLLIRWMHQVGATKSVPAMWGVNGVAGVLGSASAMILGMFAGFTFAVIVAAVLYMGVAAAALRLRSLQKG